ncbi:glutamine synthetase family protein [Granulicella tundricola]|uniref:Glutamine synthetase n=1 Tax=Granulicella tundricola (strain ATCC BAA-1859 / DSM 23138 / MP5ACTX9) TaxID=1198114 RepID=E8WVI6_GRATM|nr:glutamine synthetase family protein [Granulicella tundricola]ADW68434.1 glutamine synthetase catalytic region [Granulicella tundricola MP5ACTX9]
MSSEYRDFLELSYSELEDLNLAAKEQRRNRVDPAKIQEERLAYLRDERRIKAVMVVFSDLEGRLHMLDYDKKFLVNSYDNLTFDGSSIRGFTAQRESDLRLAIDWAAFYWTPADVFGAGKVLVFGEVIDKNGEHYAGDLRGVLKNYAKEQFDKNGYHLNAANEIEGFLFEGIDAERSFHELGSFEYVNKGGYYHSLPGDPLREFIDTTAEVQRAMGFENEKDHPEVAPSQFEINYTYGDVVMAADQIQLYKLICRQVATQMGMTASFLPKPVTGVNGSGMHTNVSITKDKTNLMWDPNGEEKTSKFGWEFVDRILTVGSDLCVVLNASVNAYRRLDPHFEAPNQIKASATDRGSMVRIPIGNAKSARVEVRSVGPDANPYMVLYTIFKTGLDGEIAKIENLRQAERYLPDNIYTALEDFNKSEWVTTILGGDVKQRYSDLKQASADRCPRLLGTIVKPCEIQFHHDVYNQLLWGQF